MKLLELVFIPFALATTLGPAWAAPHSDSSTASQANVSINLDWPSPVSDSETYGYLLLERLEYNPNATSGAIQWDLAGWRGGDYDRFWFKSEGLQSGSLNGGGIGDIQALFGRLIAPFFDFQIGLNYEQAWGLNRSASRFQGVLGLQGISPYSFELEPILFVSQSGNISVRVTASRDVILTQRAIVQFRLETQAAIQRVPDFGVEPGFNDLALGIRLRYEFRREVAPYVGVNWNAPLNQNSVFSSNSGPDISGLALVAGIRAWY